MDSLIVFGLFGLVSGAFFYFGAKSHDLPKTKWMLIGLFSGVLLAVISLLIIILLFEILLQTYVNDKGIASLAIATTIMYFIYLKYISSSKIQNRKSK